MAQVAQVTARSARSEFESVIACLVRLSAVFHDLGKETDGFQNGVLLPALRGRDGSLQPYRHEWISTAILNALLIQSAAADDSAFFRWLSDDASVGGRVDLAWETLTKTGIPTKIKALLPDGDRYPLCRTLAMIVLTHHRLIKGFVDPLGVLLTGESHLHLDDRPEMVVLKKSFSRRAETADPIRGRSVVLRAMAADARDILDVIAGGRAVDPSILSLAAAVQGRSALMIGDHRASIRKGRSFGDKFALIRTAPYANTTHQADDPDERVRRKGPGSAVRLGDRLDLHTMKVRIAAEAVSRQFRIQNLGLRGVETCDLPDGLSPAPRRSPFAWQDRAAEDIADNRGSALSTLTFLIAGVGTGKTLAAAKIARSASNGPLRMNILLGLRPLTLQVGDEYRSRVGFSNRDCAVHIGSQTAMLVHEAMKPVGTDAEEQDDEGFTLGGLEDEPLPGAFEEITHDPGRARRIATPILVTTVDQLAAASDATRGRHLAAMVRLASADLVIDEIDGYAPEDVSAIGRMVMIAASFGRNIVISSATLPPSVGIAIHTAWRKGIQIRAALTDRPIDGLVAWVSDLEGVRTAREAGSLDFERIHTRTIDRVIERLEDTQSRRRSDILDVDDADSFTAITNGCLSLHRAHAVRDPKTGARVSIGLVRFNRIATARDFARHLFDIDRPAGTSIVVCCYHSRFPLATRFLIERRLTGLLTRKYGEGETDPILADPEIRRRLDAGNVRDLMIVVSTTPIVECGRDFDADWAITEPCSTHSITQLAGRVRRHRRAPVDTVNLLVTSKIITDTAQAKIAKPGVETPYRIDQDRGGHLRQIEPELDPEFRGAVALDLRRFRNGIDAAVCLDPSLTDSAAMDLEERVRRSILMGETFAEAPKLATLLAHQGIRNALDRPWSLFDSAIPDNRKFRRKSDLSYTLFRDNSQWMICHDDTPEVVSTADHRIVPDPPLRRPEWKRDVLLIHENLFPSVDKAVAIVSEMIGETQNEIRRDLSSIKMEIHRGQENNDIAYSNVLGASMIKFR